MPLINVTMAKGRSPEEKKALLLALSNAAVESIGAPRSSIRIWINEVDPSEFLAGDELLIDKQARVAAEKAAAEAGGVA